MRIHQHETAIDAYHAHVGSGNAGRQLEEIVRFVQFRGGDWSIGELARELSMEKSTVSARVNEALNKTHQLVACAKRRDRVSGVMVRPVTALKGQMGLFG